MLQAKIYRRVLASTLMRSCFGGPQHCLTLECRHKIGWTYPTITEAPVQVVRCYKCEKAAKAEGK